jgi:hypothetical protein
MQVDKQPFPAGTYTLELSGKKVLTRPEVPQRQVISQKTLDGGGTLKITIYTRCWETLGGQEVPSPSCPAHTGQSGDLRRTVPCSSGQSGEAHQTVRWHSETREDLQAKAAGDRDLEAEHLQGFWEG